MISISAADLRRHLDYPSTMTALEAMFRNGCVAPPRHHHTVAVPGAADATLLLMPAWSAGRFMGVKIVDVFPSNGALGLPAVSAIYALFSGRTGEALAMIEGGELTARRTAAASALAARYLARPDAARLLVVGTGRVARHLARAHAAARPIASIAVWGRDRTKAEAMARELAEEGFAAEAVADLAGAVAKADIVTCATITREPLVCGAWLKAGAHLDLVGGFTPQMREADDEAVRRASVFVDTRRGALAEAGDIVAPLQSGVLRESDIKAEFADLARGRHPGRQRADEITLFKSVGAAEEDLAAAILAYERAGGRPAET